MDMKKTIKINLAVLAASSFAASIAGDIEIHSDHAPGCSLEAIGHGQPGVFSYAAKQSDNTTLGIHFEYGDYRHSQYQIPIRAMCHSDTQDYEFSFPIIVGLEPQHVSGDPRLYVFVKNSDFSLMQVITEGAGFIGRNNPVVKLHAMPKNVSRISSEIEAVDVESDNVNVTDSVGE